MTILYIALGVLALLALISLIVCNFLAGMIVRPKVLPYEECRSRETADGLMSNEAFLARDIREFTLPSRFGYSLHCMVMNKKPDAVFPDARERVAVFAHGYTYSLWGDIKYADMFYDMGFSCVFFDQRNHGLSGRAPTTMGYYERYDLASVCDWARERFGQDCVLGTHGESMGAATVMLHAPLDSKLDFVVEDCGYSSLEEQLFHNVRTIYHLPKFPTMPLASLISKLRGGVLFSSVVPKDAVAQCPDSLPMLFIHGEADEFVPAWMVQENYNAKRGKRSIATFPNGVHARSIAADKPRYRAVLEGFLRENGIL